MSITPIGLRQTEVSIPIPLFLSKVPAGFPSPADDFMEHTLDLNEHLIQHPSATFFCRVSGQSMTGLGIFDGDLLIIDRAITAKDGDVVLAAVNGELTCKRLDAANRQLCAANPDYPPIAIGESMDLVIEGVVTHSIKAHCVRAG